MAHKMLTTKLFLGQLRQASGQKPKAFRRFTASVCSLNGRETLLRLLLLLYTGSDCTPILTPANAKQLTEKPTPRRTYVYVFRLQIKTICRGKKYFISLFLSCASRAVSRSHWFCCCSLLCYYHCLPVTCNFWFL